MGSLEPVKTSTPRGRSRASPGTTGLAILRRTGPERQVMSVAHKKTTGKKAATAASKTLRDRRTSKTSKTAAASALSQTHKAKGRKKK